MTNTVPSSADWREFREEPGDFDADKVWLYTLKSISSNGTKRWSCVFCLANFANCNATKALYHQAGVTGNDVSPCLGAYNGQQPPWFTAALRALIARKGAAKEKKKDVSNCLLLRHTIVTAPPSHVRVIQKVKGQLDAFLVEDCEGMAVDVSMTRKRSSASSLGSPQ
jgi:hypothetical protein